MFAYRNRRLPRSQALMKYKAQLVMDRSTGVDGLQYRWLIQLYPEFELVEYVMQRQTFYWTVDHHTQSAIFIVLTDQGHGLEKVGILKLRHRHQKVVREGGKAGLCRHI